MSPHSRSPDQPGVAYPPQRGNGGAGGPVALGVAGGGVAVEMWPVVDVAGGLAEVAWLEAAWPVVRVATG